MGALRPFFVVKLGFIGLLYHQQSSHREPVTDVYLRGNAPFFEKARNETLKFPERRDIMRQKSRYLAQGALMAALYMALSYLQNFIIPGSASYPIQFRVAEALCVLALFSPAAIPGLTVGCLLFNLSFAGALPLDFLVGSLATALSTTGIYLLRKVRLGSYPLPALLVPATVNGLLVGWELSFHIGGAFWLNGVCVAIGELLVLLTLGSSLYYAIRSRRLHRDLFQSQ